MKLSVAQRLEFIIPQLREMEFGAMKGNNPIPGLFPVFRQKLHPNGVGFRPDVRDLRFAGAVFPENPAAKYKELSVTAIVVKQPKSALGCDLQSGARPLRRVSQSGQSITSMP